MQLSWEKSSSVFICVSWHFVLFNVNVQWSVKSHCAHVTAITLQTNILEIDRLEGGKPCNIYQTDVMTAIEWFCFIDERKKGRIFHWRIFLIFDVHFSLDFKVFPLFLPVISFIHFIVATNASFFSSSSANVKTKSNRKTMERQILHDNIMRCGDTNPNCYDIIVYDGIKSDANRALFSSAHCVRCLNN